MVVYVNTCSIKYIYVIKIFTFIWVTCLMPFPVLVSNGRATKVPSLPHFSITAEFSTFLFGFLKGCSSDDRLCLAPLGSITVAASFCHVSL